MKIIKDAFLKRLIKIIICSIVIGMLVSGGVILWNYQKMKDFRGKREVSENNIYCSEEIEKKGNEYHVSKSGGR